MPTAADGTAGGFPGDQVFENERKINFPFVFKGTLGTETYFVEMVFSKPSPQNMFLSEEP